MLETVWRMNLRNIEENFSETFLTGYDIAMKLLLALYFFILAIIQMGLFFGIYHYHRSQTLVRPNSYWMGSLLISIFGLLVFGAGIVTIADIANPEFNFTIANTFFFIAALLQGLFCKSLNQPVSRNLKISFSVAVAIFFIAFEWMRLNANFEIRTAFMCIVTSILYGWQIIELRSKRKSVSSRQLQYLQYASSAELFFALGRLMVLLVTTFTIREVEQIPQFLILFTIAQIVMNTLSYIAIGGYWAERIAVSNAQSETENQEIRALLLEREKLIGSLLKANKTAATGALSASIAHELNQPLGASSLNIQFLQKKLADGNLSSELQSEVLNTLLSDNQRAANIIRTLRSVFADDRIISSDLDMGELIHAVLEITRPELSSKQIKIELNLESALCIQSNRSEIQQVLLNLVNNAIQALASSSQINKKILIEGRHTGPDIEIAISDNGDGVSKSAQGNLFELLADSKKGMGLGLWLCKHVITRHGGAIWYEDAPTGGAKFVCRLPKEASSI